MIGVQLWLDGTIGIGGGQLAIRPTFALLDAVAEERSIQGAANRLNLSYRAAWGRLATLERTFGRALATKTKGHGSVLTPDGLALRDLLGSVLDRVATLLREEGNGLGNQLRALVDQPLPRCRIAVSHDPILMDVLSSFREVEVEVVGSREAVRLLLSGQADAAGFHLDTTSSGRGGELARLFDDPDFEVVPLFPREQGLILAKGNPMRIASIKDLARPQVRFVNRQKGSGTRTLTDQLLAGAGMMPEKIQGYETEEFTHQAVAALIASGMADAGMGVRVAAERFGLDFLPLAEETYFLATPRGSAHAAAATIVSAVRDAVS